MKKQILKGIVLVLTLCTLVFMSIGCGTPGNESNGKTYKDGVYEGYGTGNGGEVKVSVTITDGKISEIKVLEHNETEGIGSVAVENLPSKIIEAQSTEVDTVAGATLTSKAIIEGVNMALEQAK